MVNSVASDSQDGSVFIVIFDTAPTGGWLLYFKGLKQETIISKFYRVKENADELATEAIHYLAAIAKGAEWSLNVRLLGSPVDQDETNFIISTYPFLHYSKNEALGTAAGQELFDYLFASARNKKLSLGMSASDVHKRGKLPAYESVEPGKAIITSDGSYIPAGRRERSKAVGGTGWILGYHGKDASPTVVLGSRGYTPEGHYCSSNAMELHAIRDALADVLAAGDFTGHVSTLIFYSDSDFAITIVRSGDSHREYEPILSDIASLVQELAAYGVRVEFRWTKGHSGNPWNSVAHTMATAGRKGESVTPSYVTETLNRLRSVSLL